MTNRERLLATLQCQPADRAPWVWWLGFAPWGETLQRWRDESGIRDLDPATCFEFEPFASVAPLEYGPWPHFPHEVLEETAEHVVARDYRGIVTRNRRDGGSMPDFIAHPVATPADWERYIAEHLQPQLEARLARLPAFAAAARATDGLVQVGTFPWGEFGTLRDLMGAVPCLLTFYDEPELVHDILTRLTDLWLSLYERVADVLPIDHIHIWEDMSGKQGSLISVAMVEEFMMPQYDRIAAFARRRGVPLISVDSDGWVGQLVPVMMRHGINVFFPFEVRAGNDILAYRAQHPTLGILGGLDKTALAGDRAAIHGELDRATRMLATGGYVAGFDHLIPPDVPWSAYRYFVLELRRIILGH